MEEPRLVAKIFRLTAAKMFDKARWIQVTVHSRESMNVGSLLHFWQIFAKFPIFKSIPKEEL